MKEVKFKRAHFFDKEKTKFSHFSEWGVDIGWASFTSPSSNNIALYFTDLQFTCLKDKNKKDIYNGDIVRIDHLDPRYKPHISFISWDDDHACWDVGGGAPFETNWSHEVIGNKFENPELLNK